MQLGPQVAFTIGASLAGSATLLLTVMLARPILPSP